MSGTAGGRGLLKNVLSKLYTLEAQVVYRTSPLFFNLNSFVITFGRVDLIRKCHSAHECLRSFFLFAVGHVDVPFMVT